MLKIGDKVKILDGKDWVYWTGAMNKFIGKEGIITKYLHYYRDQHHWYVGGEMEGYYFQEEKLELVVPPKVLTTYRELYAEAARLKIAGRSGMNKEALIAAIAIKKPAETAAIIKPAKPSLYAELKSNLGANHAICAFALEDDKGTRVFNPKAFCHAGLSRAYYNQRLGTVTDVVDDISSHHEHHKNKELYLRFVKYILNESPWKDSFVTKNVMDALDNGVHYNVNTPISRLVCSAMSLRQGSEKSHKLAMWEFLVNEGYSGNLAWFVANGINKEVRGYSFSAISGGHDVFEEGQNAEEVLKFFKTGWHRPADLPYKDAKGREYGIFVSIAKREGASLKAFFTRNIKGKVTGEGWDKTVTINTRSILDFADFVKPLIE